MKMYLGGCEGIKSPTDLDGKVIKIGDCLTWDYGDSGEKPKSWMLEPIFVVKSHKSGKGLCAVGIDRKLYLHDFRFQFCRIVKPEEYTQ